MINNHSTFVKIYIPLFTALCIAIIFLGVSLNRLLATSSESMAALSKGDAHWLGLSVETKVGRTVGYVTGTRLDENGSLELLFVDNVSAGDTISEPTLIIESNLVEREGNSVVLNLRLVDG